MPVSAWSNLLDFGHCVMCDKKVFAGNATVACAFANGLPALACEAHRNDKAGWVATWTDFYRHQQLLTNISPATTARLYIETRLTKARPDITVDVMWHLFTRSMAGRCVVVASHPIEFLSVLRKHWKKLARLIRVERACTLDRPKRLALQEALGRLQILSFSATAKNTQAEVLVVPPADASQLTDGYATIYTCTALSQKQRLAVLKSLQQGGLCVDYSGTLAQWEEAAVT